MRDRFSIFALLALGASFVAGLGVLFHLRFESGDVYPPYSSLRTDPLGTMALYESLDRMPGIAVERDLAASGLLPEGGGTTYLHLAGQAEEWDRMPVETAEEIERFVREGGRLAVMLEPGAERGSRRGAMRNMSALDESSEKHVSIAERWAIGFATGEGAVEHASLVKGQVDQNLPNQISWKSRRILADPGPEWRTIYETDDGPVMAERAIGLGTFVVATDSWLVSNEALWSKREAGVITWLVGGSGRVVFDEAHLGIVESPGVAALVRRYRLQGAVISVLVLGLLFAWRQSSPLLPRVSPSEAFVATLGKDSATGFTSLLRRHVPKNRLLSTCFAEWKKSLGRDHRFTTHELYEVESIIRDQEGASARSRDLARAYALIVERTSIRRPSTRESTK